MTRIEQLERRIHELESERQEWLNEKVCTVQKIILKEPPDYMALKRKVRELEKENQKLERIIHFGSISSVSALISEFQSSSKIFLERLAVEMNYCFMNTEERAELREFLSYLNKVENELQLFLVEEHGNK